jgi:hypothetical protein
MLIQKKLSLHNLLLAKTWNLSVNWCWYAVNSNHPVVSSIRHNPTKFFKIDLLKNQSFETNSVRTNQDQRALWFINSSELLLQIFELQCKIQWVLSSADKSQVSIVPLSSFCGDKYLTVDWERQTKHKTQTENAQHLSTAGEQKGEWQRLWMALEFRHEVLHVSSNKTTADRTVWWQLMINSDT